jgi:hypothetical protein
MHHQHTLRALDGANPLCMLATLGAFRIATMHDPEATLHWEDQGGWRPVITCGLSEGELNGAILTELHRLAGPNARAARAADLEKEQKNLRKKAEKLTKEAEKSGRKAPSPERLEELNADLAAAAQRLELLDHHLRQLRRTDLPEGIPFLQQNDLVAVPAEKFRAPAVAFVRQQQAPTTPSDADIFAALGCDAILKEKKGVGPAVENTPFSFSNAVSGKCLIKDFRNCAAHASEDSIAALQGPRLLRHDETTSLLWEPTDQQSYALRWNDPGDPKNKFVCNATANALAFLGLCFCHALPVGGRVLAVGMDPRCRTWRWPLWDAPLTTPEASALLVNPDLRTPDGPPRPEIRRRGVVAVRESRRFHLNDRPFFSPSRALL